MIIHIWVADEDFKLIFEEKFHDILTPQQGNSIVSVFPSLLNNISKQNISDDLETRTYTIAGVYLYFFRENDFLIALSSIYNFNPSVFKKFISYTLKLLENVNVYKPNFKLPNNPFFKNKLYSYHRGIEKELSIIEKEQEDRFSRKPLNLMSLISSQEKKKYLILGTASAGKSSIIAQFFKKSSLEEIKSIKPTVLQNITQISDEFTDTDFNIVDFGGQEFYRKKYLENPDYFLHSKCLIFAIDLQNKENSEVVIDYLIKILDILKEIDENPLISIFLHKFDPDKKIELSNHLKSWYLVLDRVFSDKRYNNFHFITYITSILDNSSREGLANTLLFTLPNWFMSQTITKDLIKKSVNSLYPIIEQEKYKLVTYDQKEIEKELFRGSIPFGFEVAKGIVNEWIEFILSKKLPKKQDSQTFIEILPFDEEKKVEFHFKCPLQPTFKENPLVCQITHGLFEGLGNYLGFQNSKLIQSEIRDNVEICKLELKY